MKNTKKLLALLAIAGLLTSCEKEDLADPALQGTWQVTWVNDFVLDVKNADAFKQLCNPGNRAELAFNGSASTRFVGNKQGKATMYFGIGDPNNNSTPATTLLDTSYDIACSDIAVSSIEHRDIYVTGQTGYISKQIYEGKCMLYSERARTRPNYTVFIKLLVGSSETRTNNQGQTYTDENNRMAGITVDCDANKITASYRTASSPTTSGMSATTSGIPYANSEGVQAQLKSATGKSDLRINSDVFKSTLVAPK